MHPNEMHKMQMCTCGESCGGVLEVGPELALVGGLGSFSGGRLSNLRRHFSPIAHQLLRFVHFGGFGSSGGVAWLTDGSELLLLSAEQAGAEEPLRVCFDRLLLNTQVRAPAGGHFVGRTISDRTTTAVLQLEHQEPGTSAGNGRFRRNN